MKVGIYIKATILSKPAILVVYDYPKWGEWVTYSKMPTEPALTRKATATELEVMEGSLQLNAFWYESWDELIEDEIRSGASNEHLEGILSVYRQMEAKPEPGAQVPETMTIGQLKQEAAA